MWNCLKCFNESEDSAGYCGYCGSPRSASLENAREIANRSANPSFRKPETLNSQTEVSQEFPAFIPIRLRPSETTVRLLAATIGIFSGLTCSVAIYLFADPSRMTGRLFNLKELSGAVPTFTLILFFWGLAICILRYLRTGAAKRLSHDRLVFHTITLAKVGGLNRVITDLEIPVVDYSPLLRRLRALAKQWSIAPSLQDADLLLQQQLYSDEERVRAGYSLVRTFIWALPVIGLLGTVAGVASAVGGFAEFLRGDIEDVAVIKLSLVNVTSGLSYAFLTTLYGLAGSLVLMLIATGLQNREEKLYSTIQERVTSVFLPFLQSIAPQGRGSAVSTTSTFKEELKEVATSILDYVREQGVLTLQSFRNERDALREDVVQWGKLLREEATSGAQNIGDALERAGLRMSNGQFEFLQKFESIKSGMDQQAAATLQSVSNAVQATSTGQQEIVSAISEQQHVLRDNVHLLREFGKVSNESVLLISEIKHALDKFRDLDLEKRASTIVAVVESQSKQLEASVSALQHTSALTSTLIGAQESLHNSVVKLHETGFDETLREFRDSLTALKPVLENLREPFILQAVPIKANGTT